MTRPAATAPAAGSARARNSAAARVGAQERVGRLTSVRWRLQLITVLPMVGLALLTGLQARSSFAVAADASRAHTLASTSTATMQLLQQLGREQAESVALRDRGGRAGELLVTAQQARTDGAIASFRRAAAPAASVEGVRPALDSATTALAGLTTIRTDATAPETTVDIQGAYAPIMAALLAVADAVPAQLVDRELANRAQAIAALAGAKHALASQRDLLRTVFRRHAFASGDFAALVRYATTEQERLASFRRVAGADSLAEFDRLTDRQDVRAAVRLRDAALSAAAGTLAVDSDAWYVAATHTIRWLHEAELTLAGGLSLLAAHARDGALRGSVATVAAAAGLAMATLAAAAAIATRTSRRLGRLRQAALDAARRLPALVDEIAIAADPVRVHDEHLVAAHRGAFPAGPDDEIGQVASAFGTVHTTALRLAADQALLRLDIEGLVVALARRSQKLIQQQLRAIDDLESDETDPDTLALYYRIDHLAARMRRNDENLLLLAGAEPGRRFAGSFPLLDVVRAASAEIADYPKVEAAALPAVAVAGHAVGDVVHLLAELLENAASFSPPHTRVTVTARHTVDGVLLAVYDDGIGMVAKDLAEVNARLAQPTLLTSALAGTLGLLVVARLAARHGIGVELRSRDGTGTIALVWIPGGILAEPVSAATAPLTTTVRRRAPHGLRPPGPHASVRQGPPRASVRVPSPASSPVIYDELMSAWFSDRHPDTRSWSSPGDAERAMVGRVLAETVPGATGDGLPQRQIGARLLPGSVPDGGAGPRPIADPERVRAQLSGLSRGFAAAARTTPRESF